MTKPKGKRTNRPFKCWGCEGNHAFINCSHWGYEMRNVHSIHQASTVDDVA